jgi:adenylate cyclase
MFSCIRYIALCGVFIISFFSSVSSSQTGDSSAILPYLKQVIINSDSVISIPEGKAGNPLNEKLILSYRENNLRFELAPSGIYEFRYFLEGYDRQWTPWGRFNSKEYTNLPAGNYDFQVRYRQRDDAQGVMPSYHFKVLPLWHFSKVAIMIYLILFSFLVWALYAYLNLRFARKQYLLEQIINKRTEDLITEKEKTEALLANLLPKNAADEIMAKGKATKIKYNFVTVLFSDIQGFTRIAEEMNPEVLIDELDKFFFYFDSVVGKFGIEKIKTIGDAYMCAGGIPEKNRTNPVEVILAALEMKSYMAGLKKTSETGGMKYWDIRIGIHTGTVVAGVVGQKKLSYDIWGDTVNTASRMESSGEAGKINISGTTYEFVKDFFTCEFRGKMPVKYKGELEMYFVNGIRPELCDDQGKPNRKFILKMQMIKLQDIEERVIKLFDDEAPPNLYFHNSTLVRNICNQVELLSPAENLTGEDLINLKLAAVFLLTGYITDYQKPMEASGRLVEELLPGYGFSPENIGSVKKLIKNAFTDNPETVADFILHDARFDYLGRVDYLKLTEKLYREMNEYGNSGDWGSWVGTQKKFLYEHDFKTNTARILRSVSVEEQMDALMADVD